MRVALALALPVVILPILIIPALADVRAAEVQPERGRICWVVSAIAVLATIVILTWPGLSPNRIWWLHCFQGSVFLGGALAVALVVGRGPWIVPVIIIGSLVAPKSW
ncbi:MAG TPA: hypothetical protein VHX44_02610 [Planctomycetota bacterium]|nr:hypothetical protein [Planctomycetota bacterium]